MWRRQREESDEDRPGKGGAVKGRGECGCVWRGRTVTKNAGGNVLRSLALPTRGDRGLLGRADLDGPFGVAAGAGCLDWCGIENLNRERNDKEE